MHTNTISYQAAGRSFEVRLSSTTEGYTARVFEKLGTRGIVQVALRSRLTWLIAPSTFYRLRRHYRGELLGLIQGDLKNQAVDRVVGEPERGDFDCYIRANLRGWPEGYPDAVDDDMKDWLDALDSERERVTE
ncbi:hypothetical protein ParKJ_21985 [Paraburkholderia fungorum]|uniref:Uncharacterized protein n=1 Tax=Paraburkholderia fungorum TaxID=134537 RepID=A0AAP5QAF4_9BURK|nr:hypothetical protein [Paraburkholderia fungorum]MDT8840098.1 hypothetical protein [Paraburkholderia fungorum]